MNIQKNIYIFLFVICAKEINNLFEIATWIYMHNVVIPQKHWVITCETPLKCFYNDYFIGNHSESPLMLL
jgi:hypothetical protein